ncbi:MAG: DoxX family protein [Terracidiphilus sp.]
MNRIQQPAVTIFAVGMIGLGILALIYGDFALVWQPVASRVPGRTALAYGSGVLMILAGAGLLFRATAAWSARILFPYLIVWTLLKAPDLLTAPQIEGSWLGFGELAVLLSGGWTLFARLGEFREGSSGSWLNFATGDSGVRIARILFALWVIPIGLSHLVYPVATAQYVPAWLPFRIDWAYLTGAGQMASGLGVLFNIVPRFAAWAEVEQITFYTFLVWAPAIAAAPKTRLPWTAFFISWTIGAAVYTVAQNIVTKEVAAPQI